MWRGRFQLGDLFPLAVLCVDANGTPGTPSTLSQAPVATIFSPSVLLTSLKVPIRDRYAQDGFFQHKLLLDSTFAAGLYVVQYQWVISGTPYGGQDEFEIVAGGQGDGASISMFYFRSSPSDFILQQVDSGRLLRRRNPRL